MSKNDTPVFPGAMLDLKEDAAYAMLSDAAYGDHADLVAARDGKSQSYRFPERWSLLGEVESTQRDNFEDNRKNGLTVAAFEKQGDEERRIVLAFRGSDEAQDWYGPNVKLAADGDLLGALGVSGPKTEHTQKQMGDVQRAGVDHVASRFGRGAKDWDPQIEAALNYALDMQRKYGADHKIEVTGHSLGGAHAQIVAHTFGWGGRTFDAPGAKNIIESEEYQKWCKKNGVTPAGAPDYDHGTVQHTSLLNYTVNNSVVNERTGDHIGPKLSISSLAGRQGVLEHGQWAVGLIGGAIAETPLLDQTLGKVIGPSSKWVEYLAKGAALGADVSERHDMSRISRAFQEDVANGRTIPRQYGDASSLDTNAERVIASDPRNPDHPNHSMHSTLHAGIGRAFAEQGLPLNETAERTTAALLVNSRQAGLEQVNHVVPGRSTPAGTDLFAVQGELADPAHKRAQVNTEIAAQIPVEKSFQQLAAVNQQQSLTQDQQSQEQTRAQSARTV
ncbi:MULTISPECIES: XVIPCD domain-containing protein [unclassified Lysobacter]|uniref:XVIPCD domain-containing protein n=1 Tax=unclassified Lysobacter TaxID=2635362 RepID=UPI001BE76DB3|nr:MULTISPECIES: XVIPCD domain-containing protein [unclassified Lysobacter]MBT2748598.1 hypothetical protein [Lysobacter sp. ISL-42]MBT2751533.1 hypothetical protein [Lysobacter sp. ISL-50]MBT2775727.1 hypothetical protein [Lysobacter sp. ISL-54]MBT2782308.1 hypothetical protein [Lysobacter sp. ISL-52]